MNMLNLKKSLASPALFLMAAASLCASTGCDMSTTGEEGNFDFSYAHAPLGAATGLSTSMAVGSHVDIRVAPTGADDDTPAVVVQSASFEETSHTVIGMADDLVAIRATEAGTAKLKVEGQVGDDEALTDLVDITAVVPAAIELTPLCQGQQEATLWVAGATVMMRYQLQDDSGATVRGEGYYPVHVEPAEAGSIDEQKSGPGFLNTPYIAVAIDAGAAEGDINLVSDLEDATSLTLPVIASNTIDALYIARPTDWNPERPQVSVGNGETITLQVRPTASNDVVCPTDIPFDVQSATPDVCDVSASTSIDLAEGWGVTGGMGLVLEAKSVGNCLIDVTLPTAGELGLTQQVEVTITEAVAE